MLLTDLVLARRLERAEAQSNVDFVEARARVFPDSGATWVDVAGAYAMFDGVSSPLTQTFGLGLFDAITDGGARAARRVLSRNARAPVCHEVSPLADPSLLPLLNSRQYQPIEFTSVMCRDIDRDVSVVGTVERAVARSADRGRRARSVGGDGSARLERVARAVRLHVDAVADQRAAKAHGLVHSRVEWPADRDGRDEPLRPRGASRGREHHSRRAQAGRASWRCSTPACDMQRSRAAIWR